MSFKQFKTKFISLVITFTMLFSMSALTINAVAEGIDANEGQNEEKKDLVYVSIGDSMTNGYGLDGYDGESGIMNYGKNVYSNQFAAWLAGYTGEIADDQTVFVGDNGTVDHRQLAMSGMRAEDLAWLLQLDYANMTDDQAKWLVRFKQDPANGNADWNKNGYGGYCPCCKKVHVHGWEYEWGHGREYWYSKDVEDPNQVVNGYGFTTGDWRTWTDLLDPEYRLADGAAKVLAMYGKNGFGFVSNSVSVTDTMISTAQTSLAADAYYPKNGLNDSKNLFGAEGRWLKFIAEFYQDSVADADVITMSLGNTNFGTFMFDQIKDIFLNPTAKNWFPSRYHIDEVYLMADAAGVDDELINMIKDLINNQLQPILDEQFADIANEPLPETVVDGSAVDPYGLLESRTKGALIEYIIEYCVLSYVVNYIATLNRIVELNSDATIVQIALMNAYKTGNSSDAQSGTSFASIIDQIYGPMNAFIAMLPDYLASKNAEAYKDVTFYYSDTGTVETLSAVFGNDFYTYDGKAITYDDYQALLANGTLDVTKLGHNDSTVRERFHHWLASNQGCYDNRAHANGAEKCAKCKGYLTYYYLYVEMERNPGVGTSWGWGDVTSYGEMWKGLLARLECDFPDTLTTKPQNSHTTEYNEWLSAKSTDLRGSSLIKLFFNEYRMTYVTEQDIIDFENMTREAQNALLNGAHSYARDKAFSCAMYLAFEDATIRAGKNEFMVDDLTGVNGLGYDTFGGAVELFAEKMGLSDGKIVGEGSALASVDAYTLMKNFSDALVEDGPSATMLCLANRMQIGTGIGGHPSEGGHDTMAVAIQRDYKAKNTGDEVTEQFMLDYLQAKYPEVMEMFSGLNGVASDDLSIIITMLKMSGNEALDGIDLDGLEAQIRVTLRNFAASKTAEEQEKARAAVAELMRKLWALAAKVTGGKYVPDEDSFYVSLGDSNVTGYGLNGYVENDKHGVLQLVEGSAPVKLAQALYGENWKDHFGQYAQGALRAEDMLYILGVDEGIVLDAYYYREIEPNLLNGTIEETRKEYIEKLQKADLISINIGGGNVTTFTGEQVDRYVAGVELVEMDWYKIGFKPETMTQLDAMLDELIPLVDMIGIMDKYVPDGLEIEDPAGFARVLLESMLYGYASYNYYYPQVLERIREINPDAQLMILGMFNPVDDWSVELNGKKISIGGIVDNVMSMTNFQNLAYALQNQNTTFVDLSKTETILDDQVEKGEKEYTFEGYFDSILKGDGMDAHASADGHDYMYKQMKASLDGTGFGVEIHDFAHEVYLVLTGDYLTTAEKLTQLYEAYDVARELGILEKYPVISVAEDVYKYLDSNEYISDEQVLAIILELFECYLDDDTVSTDESLAMVHYIYNSLINNPALSDAERVAIIGGVYSILNREFNLNTNKAVKVVEDICALEIFERLSNTQIMDIVRCVYTALEDDNHLANNEIRYIAYFIFCKALPTAPAQARMARSGGNNLVEAYNGFTAGEKIAIIDAVYTVLEDNGLITEEQTEVVAFKKLYDDLVMAEEEGTDPLIPAESAVTILESLFEEIGTNEDIENINTEEIATQVVEEIFKNDNIPAENKLTIIQKVAEAAEKSGIIGGEGEGEGNGAGGVLDSVLGGGIASATEHLNVVKAITANLKAKNLMTDAQANALIAMAFDLILGSKPMDPAALLAEVYELVFNYEDLPLTVEQKIEIAVVVYDALAEYGYVSVTRQDAYDYVVDLGTEIYDILDSNWAPVIADLWEKLVALYGELETETEKLNSELIALVKAEKAELAKLMSEKAELEGKLAQLTADLEAALKAKVESNDTTLTDGFDAMVAELNGAISATEEALGKLDKAIAELTAKIDVDEKAVEAVKNTISNINIEIRETGTALDDVVAAIKTLNADLEKAYEASVVLKDAIANLYNLTLNKVDGDAVVAAAKYLIEALPAIVENIEYVYNKTNVAVVKVQNVVDVLTAFAADAEGNVDAVINGVDALAGLAEEQLEAIKTAAENCKTLAESFLKENLPAVEEAARNTYAELKEVVLRELAKAEQWLAENQQTIIMGAGALAVVVLPYTEDYVNVEFVDGKLNVTLTDATKTEIDKYVEMLQAEIERLKGEAEEAEKWLADSYNEAIKVIEDELKVLYAELEKLEGEYTDRANEEFLKAQQKLQDKIDALEGKYNELTAEVEKVNAYIDEVLEAVAAVEKALADVVAAGNVVGADLVVLWNALSALHGELVDLYNKIVELCNTCIDKLIEIYEYCGMVVDKLVEALNKLAAYADRIRTVIEVLMSIETWDELIGMVKDYLEGLPEKLLEFLTSEEVQELIAKYGKVVGEKLLDVLTYLFVEYGHDVAVKFYYYLYNNPVAVIEFFAKYGDDIVEFIVDNAEYILAILGFIGMTFGDEILDFVINNADVILVAFVDWFKIHGEYVFDLIAVYVKTIVQYYGIDDMLFAKITEAYDKAVRLLGEILEKISNGKYGEEDVRRALEALWNILSEFKEYFGEFIESMFGKIEDIIDSVEDILDFLNRLEEKIKNLVGLAKELKERILEDIRTLKNMLENIADYTEEQIRIQIGHLRDALEEIGADIEDYIHNELLGTVEDSLKVDYEKDEDSYYVAVGGEGYADILAGKLGLTEEQVATTDWADLDFDALVKADLITVGFDVNAIYEFVINCIFASYSEEEITEYVEEMFDELEESVDAELLGVLEGLKTEILAKVSEMTANADKEAAELDWAAIVGAENVKYVEAALAEIEAKVAVYGTGAELVMTAAEAYLYGVISFTVAYNGLMSYINENNADAAVVLLGATNPLNVDLTFLGKALNLGDVYRYVTKAASIQPLAYAILLENMGYADVENAETEFEQGVENGDYGEETFVGLVLDLVMNGMGILDASADGNAYIAEQIYNALNVTSCKHVYDCECDTTCNLCGAVRVAYHNYTVWWIVKAPTETEEGERRSKCEYCGVEKVLVIPKLNENVVPHTHTFSEEWSKDADYHWHAATCNYKTSCSKAVADKALHEYVNGVCVCGAVKTDVVPEPAPQEPTEDDKGLSAGAIVGIVLGSVAVAGVGGFSIFWFGIKHSTFAALGLALKAAFSKKGLASAGAAISKFFKNLFKKK